MPREFWVPEKDIVTREISRSAEKGLKEITYIRCVHDFGALTPAQGWRLDNSTAGPTVHWW